MVRPIGILLLLGASVAGAAQKAPATPSPAPAPPAETDAALRDRVTRFFQAQMNGKYRQAEQYVAEDTKDYFYVMNKAPLAKFAIARISYSDNFTKAVVFLKTEREFSQPMFPSMRIGADEEHDWKLENGLWCWTKDPTVMKTPFGEMRFSGTGSAGVAPSAMPPPIPSVADMTKTVAADKSEADLSVRRTDQVVLRNSLPGPITLSLNAPRTPGLEAKLDRSDLGPNGTARILLTYDPAAGNAGDNVEVDVLVQPTGQVIAIQVKLKPDKATGK